jgi:electron transport complex protein RnfB
MGAAFGAALAAAARRFAVAKDPRVAELEALLPQANCGGCGYGGCEGFAKAVAAGKVDPGLCGSSGDEARATMAAILNRPMPEQISQVAAVACNGGSRVKPRIDYRGITSCGALALLADNLRECRYGCIGLGTCVDVCPTRAISVADGVAAIDGGKCTGCAACVASCPKEIIVLVSRSKKVRVACSSHDAGLAVKAICDDGCTGCGVCVSACPVGAIEISGGLAVIDEGRCTNCAICVAKCPTGSLVDRAAARPKAFIGTSCTGCGECLEVCPLGAIEGAPESKHLVMLEKCIGCGQCVDVCKVRAITMAGALGHQLDR